MVNVIAPMIIANPAIITAISLMEIATPENGTKIYSANIVIIAMKAIAKGISRRIAELIVTATLTT